MQRNEKKMARLFESSLNSGMEGSPSVPELFRSLAAEVDWSNPMTEKAGLYLPADVLEDAGLFHVAGLEDVSLTIEKGRILVEPLEDEEAAVIRDEISELLPEELCAVMEDAGISPREVWDILERDGWFA